MSKILFSIVFLLFCLTGSAQILDKVISVDINHIPLEIALRQISNKGNFYFSYNSGIITPFKKVSSATGNKTVRQLLDQLLEGKYEYIETGSYIILRLRPAKITLVTNAALPGQHIHLSGYVLDASNETTISEASVYEKKQLVSALTNAQGYFRLRLKNNTKNAALTVSKFMYADTTVLVAAKGGQQITVRLSPVDGRGETVVIAPMDYLTMPLVLVDSIPAAQRLPLESMAVERTARAGFLLTARQKISSLNLRNFFTSRPYQVSFTPGLSTHGKLSGQVSNNFSLNVLGGYTGGVKGVEIAGLFNINKQSVGYAQVAGLFNINGGAMSGVQVAGLNNTLLSGASGVQVAGVSNIVRSTLNGVHAAGIYNHVSGSVYGMQVAGVSNFAKENAGGMQIAGIGNLANRAMNGVQIAGIFNYAKRLRGVQIGLINIADSSDGYSIGLLNIVLKGYHKLVLFSNETTNINAAFKTGNKKLYSVLVAGYNRSNEQQAYSFGYGIGKEFTMGRFFSINPELSSQYLYLGSVFDVNLLHKFQLDVHIRPFKQLELFAGPAFSVHYSDQKIAIPGYKFRVAPENYRTYSISSNSLGWVGWNAGISFF